jgi:hypothetical protein
MKLRRVWKRLRKASARKSPQYSTYVMSFDVIPNRVYALEGRCYSPAGSDLKAGVAVFRFMDAAGAELPGPYSGLSHSERTGWYRHLPAGPPEAPASFTLNLTAPEGASRVRITLKSNGKHPIVLSEPPVWQELGLSLSNVLTFDAAANRVYAFEGRVRSQVGVRKKAGKVFVTFADAAGTELPGPYQGLRFAEGAGHHEDFAVGPPEAPAPLSFKVASPEGACSARIALRPSLTSTLALAEAPVWRELCPAPREQSRLLLDEWHALLARHGRSGHKPIVIISSTTKPIGHNYRANRSMQFALELADLGFATIYVYDRRDPLTPLPDKLRSDLIEMPSDIFHAVASRLAVCKLPNPKIFICSIADYHAVHEIGLFKHFGWSTIYEARDDWEEFHTAQVGRWYHHTFERYLCQHAHRVVAVSPVLRRKMITLGAFPKTTHLIPNGTTRTFIEKARAQRLRRQEGPSASDRAIVGYFGHLTAAWFDWNLLIATAAARPQLGFEVIGYDPPADLSLPPNLKLLGPRPHDEIIELTRTWALAIIPFKIGQLSRAVDPIKVYEYLALGLKCVACPMGQLDQYPLVFRYEAEHEFGTTLQRALDYLPSAEDWQSVNELLEGASWQERVQAMLDVALTRQPESAAREAVAVP